METMIIDKIFAVTKIFNEVYGGLVAYPCNVSANLKLCCVHQLKSCWYYFEIVVIKLANCKLMSAS